MTPYVYDVAIVGAGIHGSSFAYESLQEGKKVLVLDMGAIASGGSGAAGAFISPKFSKAGELKELIHNAFIYSMAFYEENFPHLFHKVPLLHFAKNEQEREKLQIYKKSTSLKLLNISNFFTHSIVKKTMLEEHICIESGLVDAKEMCEALLQGALVVQEEVSSLHFHENIWQINGKYRAKNVLISTGAYKNILHEPYLKIRGIWGHRIDLKIEESFDFATHKEVSTSPTKGGIISIGATHRADYNPQKMQEKYNKQEHRDELLFKAKETLLFKEVEVLQDYMGLRSASLDYMPLVGKLVDSSQTLQKKIHFQTKKPDYDEYVYHKNLYVLNGSGGYGFVLAPYLAKNLFESIFKGKEVSTRLQPARFFARWAKREN